MSDWQEFALSDLYQNPQVGDLFYIAKLRLDISVLDLQVIGDFIDHAEANKAELTLLFILLFDAQNKGSLCLDLHSSICRQALSFFPVSLVGGLRSKLQDEQLNDFIGNAESVKIYPIIKSGDFFYFYKNYFLEERLQKCFERLLGRDDAGLNVTLLKKALDEVLGSASYDLHCQQLLGVIIGALSNFSIITGGPGTGKTSVLSTLLRVLVRLPGNQWDKIKLVAPTGKAAQRMTASLHSSLTDLNSTNAIDERLLQLEASTIHKLLQSPKKVGKKRLNIQVLIIDEVSMVDARLMVELLEALPDDCRIVFLGDKYQLPSVDAGRVLSDLLPNVDASYSEGFVQVLSTLVPQEVLEGLAICPSVSPTPLMNRIAMLTHSFRSVADIVILSQLINAGEPEKLKSFVANEAYDLLKDQNVIEGLPLFDAAEANTRFSGEWFLPQKAAVQFYWPESIEEEFIIAWFEKCYKEGEGSYLTLLKLAREELNLALLHQIFNKLEESRVLVFAKSGSHGMHKINQIASQFIRREIYDFTHEDFFHGSSIMVTKNDYSRSLSNGDVGLILFEEGHYRAYFRQNGEFVVYPVGLLQDFETSFAMTVHKSQGSEYERVLLLLPENRESRLLCREILYTGLTRAKKNCIIAGTQEIFLDGSAQKIRRQSRISLWKKESES
jgi:exodeoxyribonuclease V alpha subunit